MVKDFEEVPSEPARIKGNRRWQNHEIEKRFKEEKTKPPPTDTKPKKLELAETISNAKPDKRGSVIRGQTKFAKTIRVMMGGHSSKVLALYALSLRAQKKRLLREKLKRLEARQAQRDQGILT